MHEPWPPNSTLFVGHSHKIQIGTSVHRGVCGESIPASGVNKSDRDAFSFIYKPGNSTEKHYRFCRVPFGGETCPFMLGGVVKYRLETLEGGESVKESLKENTFVNNVVGLVSTEKEEKNFKSKATEIMSKGKFPLGKWESNIEALNNDKERAKTKLLDVGWNKKDDTFAVEIDQ